MKTTWMSVPAAMALAMTLAAPPALAQSGTRERPTRDRSTEGAPAARQGAEAGKTQPRGQAVRRAEPRPDTARDNSSSGTRGNTTSRGAPKASTPSASGTRGYATSQSAPPVRTPSASGARRDTPSQGAPPPSAPSASGTRGYATSRGVPPASAPSASGTRGYATSRTAPPPARNQWNGRGSRGYGSYAHTPYGNYNRDAWRGRAQFGLGLSIFAGNPFRFHFAYGWRPSFAYHYRMMPGLAYGGMSFVLDPYYTEIYIDGQFVGVSTDFGGQPVPVAAGFHRIELYAPGFVPVTFDIQVYPGQVIPYHGTLYPEY